MTEDRLKQYQAACRERDLWAKKIRQLENRRNHCTVLDSDGPGGTLREINIWQRGHNEQTYRTRYAKWLQKAESLLDEIDSFIDAIEDSQMRQIVEHRFKEGLTWQAVALHMGWKDESTPRKKFDNFMESRFPPKIVC